MTQKPTPPGRVLLADDDPDIRFTASERLRSLGFCVKAVPTGAEAMEQLTSWRPDVLLVDLQMPGNESLELLETMASSDLRVPIVILTGYPTLQTALESLRLGVVDYVTKPPQWDDLKRRLTRAIRRGQALALLTDGEQRFAQLRQWLNEVERVSPIQAPAAAASPAVSDSVVGNYWEQLSAREREVATLLAEGSTASRIGETLGLSVNTVRAHMRSMFVKLQVNSQVALLGKLFPRR